MTSASDPSAFSRLAADIKDWAAELGFADLRIADAQAAAADAESGLQDWLDAGFHGQMAYMAAHGSKRAHPAQLVPGTLRVISVRMDYLPRESVPEWRDHEIARQADPAAAVISVYARGRDYHKVLRHRLQLLAEKIRQQVETFSYRVFTDSAPVMEVTLAQQAGLGWRGKHTLLLNREAGSMFFLGEIYTDLPLPVDAPTDEETQSHCGSCAACMAVCPTQAIVAPYRLDARRCISYLTIELKESIPLPLRPLIGNRIVGCDDCQLVCPWNKFAQKSALPDFDERNQLGTATLTALFAWTAEEFDTRLQGSAIRRIGHERWLRNIAVALGNAAKQMPGDAHIVASLKARADHPSELVREHVAWALAEHASAGQRQP